MQWMAATRLGEHVFGRPAAAPFGVDDALDNLFDPSYAEQADPDFFS